MYLCVLPPAKYTFKLSFTVWLTKGVYFYNIYLAQADVFCMQVFLNKNSLL